MNASAVFLYVQTLQSQKFSSTTFDWRFARRIGDLFLSIACTQFSKNSNIQSLISLNAQDRSFLRQNCLFRWIILNFTAFQWWLKQMSLYAFSLCSSLQIPGSFGSVIRCAYNMKVGWKFNENSSGVGFVACDKNCCCMR